MSKAKDLLNACVYCHTGALRLNGMWALTSTRPFPAKFPPWLRRETMRLTGLADVLLAPATALPTLLLTQVGMSLFFFLTINSIAVYAACGMCMPFAPKAVADLPPTCHPASLCPIVPLLVQSTKASTQFSAPVYSVHHSPHHPPAYPHNLLHTGLVSHPPTQYLLTHPLTCPLAHRSPTCLLTILRHG